jgi:hypothetical protein
MIKADLSTFSMGFMFLWTTMLVKVLSKLWVAATTTWRAAWSMERLPDRERASRRS